MTGKELIIYIVQNNLEDEEFFGEDGSVPGFMTVAEAAVKFEVGIATVNTWIVMRALSHVKIGNVNYIPIDATPDP